MKGETTMWIWILITVLVLLFLALLGAGQYFFRFSILRTKTEGTGEEYEQDGDSIWNPFAQRMKEAQKWIEEHTAETLEITSFDGLKLRALYLPSDLETPKGTVLAFHGYRSLATVDFALEAEFFHDLGYRVVLPYQRSHGLSEGKYITYGAKERFDCRDWANYLEKRFGPEDLFLMGISMGSATVMMASDLELPPSVRGIVADCGFTSPWEIMKHVSRRDFRLPAFPLLYILDLFTRVRAGFALREADSRISLSRTKLPVLFLHGGEDDFVPVSMTEENFKACRGEKEKYLVPGAVHAQSFAADTAGCEEKIAGFLKKHGTRG